MKILFNHDPKTPECLFTDSALALKKLGCELQQLSDNLFYESESSDSDEYYNAVLKGVRFVIEEDDSDKVAITLHENIFEISGSSVAMSSLGKSLVNIFDDDATASTHLHYDYLDGHGLTRESNISLVISCNIQ